jgi:hypothetical protein
MTELHDIANELIRETYRSKSLLKLSGGRDLHSVRKAVANAKRFMLDDAMSSFMAELATVPFKVAQERRPDVLDSLRHSARLPFPQVFVQYNYRAFRRGLEAERVGWRGEKTAADGEVLGDIGWLCEADASDPDLIWIAEYFELEGRIATPPFRFAYRTDDRGFAPSLKIDTRAGMFAHGISGHRDQNIGVQYRVPLSEFPKSQLVEVQSEDRGPGQWEKFEVHALVEEFSGVVRYVLALLATLNNIPKIETQVRPAKSYMGGGQIRKYLDHTTLRLSLPVRTSTTTLAKRLIAAARRGWHQVRPHWRIYHRGEKFCASRSDHVWLEADETGHANCKQCDARRVWIVLPDGRGDPTISVRTHKYALTHAVT